jgi:DNA-binding CsgD family transcriptional regulator/PAS domain-containing protein
MREYEKLTRLVASIYDAALDSSLWAEVLPKVAEFAGGQAGGLLAKDSIKKCVNAYCHFGVDPHYMRLYADTYWKLDPIATSLFSDVDQVVSISELVPYDEFRQGRFFREWAQPQGWVDAASVVFEKSVSGCSYLSVVRDEASGRVDDEMRRRMAMVVPHVRRAVFIGKAIGFRQAEAATFSGILDGLSAGVVLVDAAGRIVHANAAGHDIIGAGDILRSAGGRLVAGDAQVDRVLNETVAAAGNGDAEIGSKGIALSLTAHNGDRYVAHMLPLTSGARLHTGVEYTAAAALFVRKATLACSSPPEVIGRTYKLTPAELRVLLGIVEIGGVPEVAAAFGVADTTVKTHLGRLFEKTGTGRQADLVKLVAGYCTPLAG